ncbi:MAG: acyltransferase family protein [Candidatus Promineifilaceae bacterium]|nr:acyltransferase family protein [Candidatus Promineifilaceae bacterium]
MAQISMQVEEKYPTSAAAKVASRLYFVDHFRAAVIILVVLHHLAIVYGEGVSFWYVDPPREASLSGLVMVLFVLMNQAWFMGTLFLLAGYFTPGSFDRKGSNQFLKDRLIRLGVPLLVWIIILNPLSNIGLYLEPAARIASPLTWQGYWQAFPDFIGLGVAWFLALLLIFSFGYVVWRGLKRNRVPSADRTYSPPRALSIALFILGLALVTYLVRILIPIGKSVLDFPTLAYLPQYLSFFVVGAVAYRRDWLRTISDRMGKVSLIVAVVATLLLFPFPILGILGGTLRFLGNGSWPSAIYALWDSTFAVCITIAGLTFFRRYLNKRSSLGSFLAQQSYAVYVIHSPIIILLTYGFYRLTLSWAIDPGPLVKFGIAALVIVPFCFVVAYVIRKIPGVSRVL